MAKRMTSTKSPAITGIERPNIKTSLFHSAPDCSHRAPSPRNSSQTSARKLFPLLHVSDSVFVAGDGHFRAFREWLAVFAARTNALAHSLLLEDHFAGALRTDRR